MLLPRFMLPWFPTHFLPHTFLFPLKPCSPYEFLNTKTYPFDSVCMVIQSTSSESCDVLNLAHLKLYGTILQIRWVKKESQEVEQTLIWTMPVISLTAVPRLIHIALISSLSPVLTLKPGALKLHTQSHQTEMFHWTVLGPSSMAPSKPWVNPEP